MQVRAVVRQTLKTLGLAASSLVAAGVLAQAFDLNQLERQGRLESAYEQAVAEGSGGVFGSAERQQQVEAMRDRLAQRELARLEAELKKNRQVFGVASLASTEALRGRGDKLKKYDEVRFAQWSQRLDSETERAKKVMETVRSKLGQTPEVEVQARLDLMKSLALLGGAGSEEEKTYLQAVATTREAAFAQGQKAFGEGRHAVAAAAFELVARLDPAHREAAKLLVLARLGIIEGLWREAADDTARTQALQLLQATVATPEYAVHRAEAAPAAARVQAVNVAQVRKALDEARLIDAIGGVLRGRRLAAALGTGGRLAEETALLDRLREASAKAAGANQPGLAYAYQRVADELIAREPETQKQLGERRQLALAALRPAVRLSVNAAGAEGAPLAERLRAAMTRTWPADVALADAAVDGELQVTVADAGVDSEERKGRKVFRAPGGSEEVGVDVYLLRKKARLAVTAGFAAPGAAAVSVSETFRAQAEDERHDGLQVGSLVVPVKLAELPSDALMLERLADEAAVYALGRLAAVRADPVQRLAGRAAALGKSGPLPAAAEALAQLALAKDRAGQPAKADYDRAQRDALLAAPALFGVKTP